VILDLSVDKLLWDDIQRALSREKGDTHSETATHSWNLPIKEIYHSLPIRFFFLWTVHLGPGSCRSLPSPGIVSARS